MILLPMLCLPINLIVLLYIRSPRHDPLAGSSSHGFGSLCFLDRKDKCLSLLSGDADQTEFNFLTRKGELAC